MFSNHGYNVIVLSDYDQQLTLKFLDLAYGVVLVTSFVYVNYYMNLRIGLWDNLYSIAHGITYPLLTSGDFNMVWNREKRIGGVPIQNVDTDVFESFIESSGLAQMPFKGILLTWWNGRAGDDDIF